MQRLTEVEKQLVEKLTPFALNFAVRHFGDDDEILSAAQWALIGVAPKLAAELCPRKLIACAVARECIKTKRRQLRYTQCDAAWWDTQIEPVLPEILDDVRDAVDSLPWGQIIAEEYFIKRTPIREIAAGLRMNSDRLTARIDELRSLIIDRLEKCA